MAAEDSESRADVGSIVKHNTLRQRAVLLVWHWYPAHTVEKQDLGRAYPGRDREHNALRLAAAQVDPRTVPELALDAPAVGGRER